MSPSLAALLAALALAGCGDSFATGDAAGASTTTAGGAGGVVTSTTGAGGAATSTSGAGGATTSTSGSGGAATSGSGGAGGATTSGSGGAGGATTTTTPPPQPVCQGTPFTTLPSAPKSGLPFELHMDIHKPGQGWTCIDFQFTCAGGGSAVTLAPGQPTADGYTAAWSVQGCTTGAALARFAQHVKTGANCYCDGDPGTCPYESDGQVKDGGFVEAECAFEIAPGP